MKMSFEQHIQMVSLKLKTVTSIILLLLGSSAQLSATNASLGTIEQPINLVGHSDPASIPLGPVVYVANYNYGIHKLISTPRPCLHGVMEWSGGLELNQNLANVFGISVEPEDETQVPFEPVNIRIKAWDKPNYSPYTKEQVLAATLHCLIRSAGGTPKHPLKINIIAENFEDLTWAKKYEKHYIHHADYNGTPVTPTEIPGTTLTTNIQGITSVNFTDIKPKLSDQKSQPVMIATRMGGADGAEETCALIPVWVGTTWEKPLSAMGTRCGLYHDLFSPNASFCKDANLMTAQHDYFRLSSHEEDNETSISLTLGETSESDLAASLYAAIITVQPSLNKPLTIDLRQPDGKLDQLPSFVSSKGWKKVDRRNSTSIECQFSIDSKTGKLTTGSIPFVKKLEQSPNRAIRITTIDPKQ